MSDKGSKWSREQVLGSVRARGDMRNTMEADRGLSTFSPLALAIRTLRESNERLCHLSTRTLNPFPWYSTSRALNDVSTPKYNPGLHQLQKILIHLTTDVTEIINYDKSYIYICKICFLIKQTCKEYSNLLCICDAMKRWLESGWTFGSPETARLMEPHLNTNLVPIQEGRREEESRAVDMNNGWKRAMGRERERENGVLRRMSRWPRVEVCLPSE